LHALGAGNGKLLQMEWKKSQNEQVTKLHSKLETTLPCPNWFSTCLDEIAQHKKPANQVSERIKFS
jgi:hypothetical protein